jgi:hypothetical protein
MEKRKHRRVAFQTLACVQSGEKTISGMVDNLSMKGMFVLTNEKIQTDIPLEISIILSGSSSVLSIKAMGIALRQTETGVAFKFQELDFDSFIHLRNVVAMNSDDADACNDEYYDSITAELTHG